MNGFHVGAPLSRPSLTTQLKGPSNAHGGGGRRRFGDELTFDYTGQVGRREAYGGGGARFAWRRDPRSLAPADVRGAPSALRPVSRRGRGKHDEDAAEHGPGMKCRCGSAACLGYIDLVGITTEL